MQHFVPAVIPLKLHFSVQNTESRTGWWWEMFFLAKAYAQEHGHWPYEDHPELGKWAEGVNRALRLREEEGRLLGGKYALTTDRLQALGDARYAKPPFRYRVAENPGRVREYVAILRKGGKLASTEEKYLRKRFRGGELGKGVARECEALGFNFYAE